MKTKSFRKADQTPTWYLVDASGQTLGRMASQVASVLRGKHKPTYTPHEDLGDHVVIINARHVRLTGNKLKDKVYHHHTGYIGGRRIVRSCAVFAIGG